jgi:hypothetical protein
MYEKFYFVHHIGLVNHNKYSTFADAVVVQNTSLPNVAPVIRKKEREHLGMFEYRRQDEAAIIKKLITGK